MAITLKKIVSSKETLNDLANQIFKTVDNEE